MNAATTFSAGHDDLIHHISYDYYGTRLATCSSDQRIKVWDLIDDKWTSNDTFKAHDGSVVKLSWAHPEFGQILASGSFDRTVRIWEESQQDERDSGKRWFERTRFSDSKGSVQDVKWAPSFAGLKLAVCEASGVLRIYDCLDPVNMTPWESVQIEISSGPSNEPAGQYCLDWCTSKQLPQMLVVGCGKENHAVIFSLDQNSKWVAGDILGQHSDLIRDVAWAPSMGSRDGHVRIFRLKNRVAVQEGAYFAIDMVADFTEHIGEVWRVQWNVTGTILSSSGDDGKVHLWGKASYLDEWSLLSTVSSEQGGSQMIQ